jgi:hypothetical protein
MKHSQLKQFIKEEIQKILKENIDIASELSGFFQEETRSTLNEGIGDEVLEKIYRFLKSSLWNDLKLSHGQAVKLTNLVGDLIEKELKK